MTCLCEERSDEAISFVYVIASLTLAMTLFCHRKAAGAAAAISRDGFVAVAPRHDKAAGGKRGDLGRKRKK
ncbi:MAG TPA: hypothetical protein P5294_01750 [Smithellaceae bacterium]|nr:hypothetical protein [Smithellaceae bacterium]HRS89682.1 hypothetical protein [Smithellaceae bacterium]HRV25235.1 hypothetical protein [Smithellaceae bacterium]